MIYIPLKLVRDLGFSKRSASVVFSVYGTFSFLTRVLHGFLLDYKIITSVNLYLLSLVVSGILPLLSPLVKPLAGHFVLAVTFGVGTGAMQALTTLLAREFVPVNQASNAIGVISTAMAVGVVIGSQMTGKYLGSSIIIWLIITLWVDRVFRPMLGVDLWGVSFVCIKRGMPYPSMNGAARNTRGLHNSVTRVNPAISGPQKFLKISCTIIFKI